MTDSTCFVCGAFPLIGPDATRNVAAQAVLDAAVRWLEDTEKRVTDYTSQDALVDAIRRYRETLG